MSDEPDDPGMLRRAYRTVTPRFRGRDDVEMNTIGWAIFLGMLALLIPLLPFILVIWLVGKLLDATRR